MLAENPDGTRRGGYTAVARYQCPQCAGCDHLVWAPTVIDQIAACSFSDCRCPPRDFNRFWKQVESKNAPE